jgi:hypothetical protein
VVWREVRLLDEERSLVRVRPVRLWGKAVEVDERGAVLCTHCRRLVDVEVLGRPGNAHPVGLIWPSGVRAMPGHGQAFDASDPDEDRPAARRVW